MRGEWKVAIGKECYAGFGLSVRGEWQNDIGKECYAGIGRSVRGDIYILGSRVSQKN